MYVEYIDIFVDMKKKLSVIVCLCGFVLPLLAQFSLLPTPAHMQGGKGVFIVGQNVRVCGNGGYADNLSQALADTLNHLLDVSAPSSGMIVLEQDEKAGMPDEAYTLVVTPEQVKLRSSSESGLYYAKEAFVQLVRMGKGRVHACRIEDAPRYGWRGFMLDESRHFFGKEKVKQYLDIMASLRMNVFHWHLTDEPGWRIEIKRYPKLTTEGAVGNWHDPDVDNDSLADKTKSYTYISNHRDIILDSGFLSVMLVDQGGDTVEIAIGDNLLIYPWIKRLVRINKSFIVQRGLPMRLMLESSARMSRYMHYTISQKKQSIWIAQREGRAKDSDDRTQDSVLKMLAIGGEGDVLDRLMEMNIAPLSISYEFDPCDFLKAWEFQLKRDHPDY